MKWMLIGGAILGGLAVASGAFGAHALVGLLDERARGWYDTAVTYHARHALALVACGLLAGLGDARGGRSSGDGSPVHRSPGPRLAGGRAATLAALAFTGGTLVFSGSLYLMAFTGWTRLGMITPIGGALLIAGWIAFAVAAARLPSTRP